MQRKRSGVLATPDPGPPGVITLHYLFIFVKTKKPALVGHRSLNFKKQLWRFSVNIFLCAPGSSSGYCLAFGHIADAQCLQYHCFIHFAQVLIYFMQRVCLMLISPSQLEAKSKFFQSYFIIVIAILRQCFAATPDWP